MSRYKKKIFMVLQSFLLMKTKKSCLQPWLDIAPASIDKITDHPFSMIHNTNTSVSWQLLPLVKSHTMTPGSIYENINSHQTWIRYQKSETSWAISFSFQHLLIFLPIFFSTVFMFIFSNYIISTLWRNFTWTSFHTSKDW